MPPVLGHLLSLLGAIPKGAGSVVDINPQIPASIPRAAAPGWAHVPEHPFQSSQSSSSCFSLRFIWAGRGRESRLLVGPGSLRNNSLELIGISPGPRLLPFNPQQDLRNLDSSLGRSPLIPVAPFCHQLMFFQPFTVHL